MSEAEAPNVVGPSKRKAYEFPDQPGVNAEGKLEATHPRRAIGFSPLSAFPDSQSLPPQNSVSVVEIGASAGTIPRKSGTLDDAVEVIMFDIQFVRRIEDESIRQDRFRKVW